MQWRKVKRMLAISMLVPALLGAGPAESAWEMTYASSSISYALEGNEEPPETATILIIDETSGQEFEREVPRLEIKEKGSTWSDDFSFPLTVTGYDADSFLLGDVEIPAGNDLSEYGEEFLSYLGLPQDCYRVERIVWTGEPYEQDGIICRNAEAFGEKLIRNVDVYYGGQVLIPVMQDRQYTDGYEEISPATEEDTTEESLDEPEEEEALPDAIVKPEPEAGPESTTVILESRSIAPPEPVSQPGLIKQITQWLTEHLTVISFGTGFFFVLLAAVILFWVSGRKKRKRTAL